MGLTFNSSSLKWFRDDGTIFPSNLPFWVSGGSAPTNPPSPCVHFETALYLCNGQPCTALWDYFCEL